MSYVEVKRTRKVTDKARESYEVNVEKYRIKLKLSILTVEKLVIQNSDISINSAMSALNRARDEMSCAFSNTHEIYDTFTAFLERTRTEVSLSEKMEVQYITFLRNVKLRLKNT